MPPSPSATTLLAEDNVAVDDVLGSGKRGQVLKGEVQVAFKLDSFDLGQAVGDGNDAPVVFYWTATSASGVVGRQPQTASARAASRTTQGTS